MKREYESAPARVWMDPGFLRARNEQPVSLGPRNRVRSRHEHTELLAAGSSLYDP